MSKDEARNRTEILKRLREQHQASVSATQALLKELQAIRKEIRQAMQTEPRTVPELAAATGLPANEVLWHVIAMKKYNLVSEVGLDDGYYRYSLAEEVKK
jgi:predicted Rossmann fold nucleotide-binding protein DprA/Smf involved in DNA uptake